jgi:hypothetical protein
MTNISPERAKRNAEVRAQIEPILRDPTPTPLSVDALRGLLGNCIPEPNSGCWLWLGVAYEYKGRWKPYFFMDGKNWLAHRASKWLHHGPYDLRAFICHKCDNPLCVNPDHLYVGDHASNMRDMAARKRSHFARRPEYAKAAARALGLVNDWAVGEKNPTAKLSAEQAETIRSDTRKTKLLAELYGVHRTTIQRIRRRSIWNA